MGFRNNVVVGRNGHYRQNRGVSSQQVKVKYKPKRDDHLIAKMVWGWVFTAILSVLSPLVAAVLDKETGSNISYLDLTFGSSEFVFIIVMLAAFVMLEGIWSRGKCVLNIATLIQILVVIFGTVFYVLIRGECIEINICTLAKINKIFLASETLCAIITLIIIGCTTKSETVFGV